MNYFLLAILFALSGFFMKISDDFVDVNDDLKSATIFGVLCALTSAAVAVGNAGAAYIIIAIPIGNFFAFKIDGIHHFVTMVLFAIICLICGIPQLNFVVLLICILAALADEVGHELVPEKTDNEFLNLFFEYRFVMKIVILLLACCGAFSFSVFVCFIMFELAYVLAGIVFEKFN